MSATMYWYDHDMGWWGFVGMSIGMVLFWAVVIVGIVMLIRFLVSSRQEPPVRAQTAEEVLAVRFARGEISETDYRNSLAVLHNSQPS